MKDRRRLVYTAKATIGGREWTIKRPRYDLLQEAIRDFVANKSYTTEAENSYQAEGSEFQESYCKTLIFPEIQWDIDRERREV